MWLLVASALLVVVLVRCLKPNTGPLAHFKGISVWEVFVLKNIHPRVTALRQEHLVCMHTPAFSALLATTPEAAKVRAHSFVRGSNAQLAVCIIRYD